MHLAAKKNSFRVRAKKGTGICILARGLGSSPLYKTVLKRSRGAGPLWALITVCDKQGGQGKKKWRFAREKSWLGDL
jgi:hypothetical protein